jgi:biopolymer transport protein TolQ
MIILIVCSIYSWAVIIEKIRLFKELINLQKNSKKSSGTLSQPETFYNSLPAKVDDPMAVVFQDAMESLLKKKSKNNLSERMSTFLEVGIEKQMSKIDKGFTFLATVGSTAPFIGLFGTVWGIMNSFQSIAISRNTSLAIVAPGIAEALFATALGLLAAIPAVVAYNKFNTDSQKYSQKLENFSKRFLTII